MPMPDRMRKQSSRWKLHDLNEEKGKQQILQKSLLFQTVDKTLLVSTPEAFFLFSVQKVCT